MSSDIYELIKKCLELLKTAPEKTQKRISRLLAMLDDFLHANSSPLEKTVPILLVVFDYILNKEYWQATVDLLLLLSLLQVRDRKQSNS